MTLTSESCEPCRTGMGKLSAGEVSAMLGQVSGWGLTADAIKIEKEIKFKNFIEAQAFVNRVGALAENEGHHPDISYGWGYARISIYTHKAGGLTRNDFILAAKIDGLA